MKINKFDLSRLRNEELFTFFADTKRLIEEAGAQPLHIEDLFAAFAKLFGRIDTALDYIRKNVHTQHIAEKDYLRDSIYRGFVLLAEAYLHHTNAGKVQAAKDIQVVIDAFRDFRSKPYNEETGAITNFIDDIRARCASQVDLLGAREWIDDLEAANREFDQLMGVRFDERAAQKYINLRDTRHEAEKVYGQIADRINAAILLNGEATYAPFVKKLNERVEYNKNTLAQRKGRNKKNDK